MAHPRRFPWAVLCVALWLAARNLCAAEDGREPGGAVRAGAGAEERIAILGASVSQGFGAPPGWGAVVDSSRATVPKARTVQASVFFFNHPVGKGTALADAAKAFGPTLVLAIDYLFWFGYGAVDVEGKEIESEDARLRLLERGLTLLEGFGCPLVVGDFPDASAAVGGILGAAQMPRAETLEVLNTRLRGWAKGRTNVVVVPLAEWMRRIRAGEEVRIGELSFGGDTTAGWLQADRLHPTIDGLVALAMLVNDRLVGRGFLNEGSVVRDPGEIGRRVAAVRREERQRLYDATVEVWRRRVEALPAGSRQRLETRVQGWVQLCGSYPEQAAPGEELVRLLGGLGKDEAAGLIRAVDLGAVPAEVRERIRGLVSGASAGGE